VVIQYKLIDSDTYLSVLPEDAGEYVAIFTVDAEDEYSGLSKTINFEIFKAEVSQPEIDSKPYNASIQIADISDTLVYQVSKNDGGKDVGTYYVELTIIDANYKWENTTQAKIDVPFVITQGQADVTNLKIENWTYNKDAKTPTAEKNFGNIYFTYSNSLTGQFSSVAPTNAGKHYVKATIDTTANYLGDYEIIEFEIYKAISKISNLKIDNWTYNEESKTPSANCNIGEIVYTYLGENDSTYSNNAPDYAGQHTLKAEIIETDNYYGCEETINFVIYQANVKSPNVGFKTYSKETLKSDITGNDIYSVTQNNGGVDVGFYDVKLTITDSNYKWEDSLTADLILKFEIQQATNEWISLPEIENWTFGEDAKQPSAKSKFGSYYVVYKKVNQDGTYIDTNLQEAGNFVAIFNVDEHKNYTELCTEINFIIYQDSIEIPTYNAEYTGVNMVANVNGGTQYVATINNGGVNVGTYNVELKIIDSNYKWKDKEDISVVTTFNITKSKAVITDLKLDDWRYKEPNTPTAQTNFGIIKYYYSSEESTGYEETQPENVGNYYLKAVVEETLNYDGCSEIIEFKITQNSAVITDLKIDDWKYGSNPNEPSAKTNFGIISYSYYDENNSLVNELINAGNYYVKATVEGCDNYTGDEKTFDFVIEKFELDIPTFEPKKYTGSTLSCGLTSNEKYTVENGEGIDANTYVVSLTIINSNYKWKDTEDITVTSNFVIEKGQEEITSLTLSDWTYLNKPEPNNPTANSKFGEIYYYYSDSENGTYESTQPQTPGTYWLKAVVEETENYYGDVEKISFKISKAQPVIETLSIDNWVYNADPSNPYIEKSSFVDDNNLTFFYKEGTTNDGEWSISVPTLAGEYTLKAVIAETDTHLSCEETTTFKILKDTPVITAPVYDTVYLNIVDLSNDYASAPVAKNLLSNEITGEWSYGSINFVDGENASTFTLTFNPSDSNNYNSKSVTVNLTVKSVARISSTYYATIEDALENAVSGNVVMVLPDTTGNVMIKEEVVVINTGVTLSLPFGPNDADRTTDGVAIYDVGDSSSYGGLSKLSCKSIVTVAENVVIKNYGILEVNGQMSAGGGGHKYSSHTAANYAELRLLNGSKIESYGDMKITGFIYDYSTTNASEIIAHQGTLYMPFVMRDFRGGSYMFAVYIKIRNYSTSPFNEYQFRNISSRLTLKYDAKLVGYGNLYASSTINTTTVNFVGNSSSYMVQFTTSDSYLVAKYDLNTEVCDLDLYGGATVNKMTMKIVGYSIDTSKVYFPLNWAFDISFNKSSGQDSATYNLPNKYKMLTGSYITINKGAVVTIESLNIYESYTDGNSTVIYPNKPAAKLVVRGTLNCTNLGGKVYAEKDTSDPNNIVDPVVNVTGNTTVTTYETAGKVNGSSFLASIEKWNAFTHTYQLIS